MMNVDLSRQFSIISSSPVATREIDAEEKVLNVIHEMKS